jgi:putative nucleotidyltransferase with HDIG domain
MATNAPTPKKRVLVVDDDEQLRSVLKRLLEKANFEVSIAINGKLGLELLDMEQFDVVVSDIHMPSSPVSGIELFEHIKKSQRPIPVILMTGFATIAETKNAHDIGVTAFLAKPFKIEDLLGELRTLFGLPEKGEAPPGEEIQFDANFSKLSIDDFISGKEIQHSIFIRLGENKYVKIAHSGENLPVERIRSYKDKKIKFLYLLKEDFNRYLSFTLGLATTASKSPQISSIKKVNLLKHTGEVILEQLYSNEVHPEALESAKVIVENTVSLLSESQNTFELLLSLNSHADYLYAHSIGVSFYAVMIARAMDWTSHSTLFKVGLAGLLHDIGKKEIDRSILMKSRSSLSLEEVKILETHPGRSLEILSAMGSIPEDLIQVVYQHHEREFGNGYPLKLPKAKITPLARLIAVADEFCKFAVKNPDSGGMSPKAAAARLLATHGKALDMNFIETLGKIIGVDLARN